MQAGHRTGEASTRRDGCFLASEVVALVRARRMASRTLGRRCFREGAQSPAMRTRRKLLGRMCCA